MMASANTAPVLASPLVARAAFEEDLVKVLKGRRMTWDGCGWTRLHPLGLVVPITATAPGQAEPDQFHLRLEFYYYPDWPPSAQFVNPNTNSYVIGSDLYWLPKIEGTNEIQVHENYRGQDGQLICSSITVEFYKVLHSVEARHVWNHQHQNFAHTLNQIEWALNSAHYRGRFRANPV